MMVVVAFFLSIGAFFWRAHVLTVLWPWFVTPVVRIEAPHFLIAAGLILIISLLRPPQAKSSDPVFAIVSLYLDPLIALSLGWLIKEMLTW